MQPWKPGSIMRRIPLPDCSHNLTIRPGSADATRDTSMRVSGLISGSGSARWQTTHGPLIAHPSRDLSRFVEHARVDPQDLVRADMDVTDAKPTVVARALQIKGTVDWFDEAALRAMPGVIDVA